MFTRSADSTACGGVDSTTAAVLRAVAEREGSDPVDLPALYDAIDPDALDALFASTRTGTIRSGSVSFEYAGYRVTVVCEADRPIVVDLEPGNGIDDTAGPTRSERRLG